MPDPVVLPAGRNHSESFMDPRPRNYCFYSPVRAYYPSGAKDEMGTAVWGGAKQAQHRLAHEPF